MPIIILMALPILQVCNIIGLVIIGMASFNVYFGFYCVEEGIFFRETCM